MDKVNMKDTLALHKAVVLLAVSLGTTEALRNIPEDTCPKQNPRTTLNDSMVSLLKVVPQFRITRSHT
ncbi:uncharacterized protein V6R79_003417, partial [Siganus canaliculatus]